MITPEIHAITPLQNVRLRRFKWTRVPSMGKGVLPKGFSALGRRGLGLLGSARARCRRCRLLLLLPSRVFVCCIRRIRSPRAFVRLLVCERTMGGDFVGEVSKLVVETLPSARLHDGPRVSPWLPIQYEYYEFGLLTLSDPGFTPFSCVGLGNMCQRFLHQLADSYNNLECGCPTHHTTAPRAARASVAVSKGK
jgi:hypothetical protein